MYFSPTPGDVPRTSQKLEELVGKYCDYDLHVFGPKGPNSTEKFQLEFRLEKRLEIPFLF